MTRAKRGYERRCGCNTADCELVITAEHSIRLKYHPDCKLTWYEQQKRNPARQARRNELAKQRRAGMRIDEPPRQPLGKGCYVCEGLAHRRDYPSCTGCGERPGIEAGDTRESLLQRAFTKGYM